MKTAKEAIASFLNYDYSELSEYNYKAGHFTKAVYSLESGYYSASRTGNDLPKPTRKNGMVFKWIEIPCRFCNAYGWKIYKAEEAEL